RWSFDHVGLGRPRVASMRGGQFAALPVVYPLLCNCRDLLRRTRCFRRPIMRNVKESAVSNRSRRRPRSSRPPAQGPTTVRPTRHFSAVLGFLMKGEVDAIFKQTPFRLPDDPADPMAHWQRSLEGRGRLTALDPLQDGALAPLPEGARGVAEVIKRRRTYRVHYENVADYHFGLVPAAALLAPQWFADLDYVDELAKKLRPEMSVGDLLDFTMPEGFITEPIINGNEVIFSSARADLSA